MYWCRLMFDYEMYLTRIRITHLVNIFIKVKYFRCAFSETVEEYLTRIGGVLCEEIGVGVIAPVYIQPHKHVRGDISVVADLSGDIEST